MHCFEYICFWIGLVDESEEMQARPVYVAAVDLACKLLLLEFKLYTVTM